MASKSKPTSRGLAIPWPALGVAAVLGAAMIFRFWSLASVPAGLSHDEAYDAMNAIDILDGKRVVFFEQNNGREALFMYLVALSFRFFGVGPLQLRAVSALAGVATVGLLYLLGRRLFGWRAGLLAAGLLAISFWPIFESRLGLRESLLPPLLVLVAYGLWRWLEAERGDRSIRALAWAALAGFALGASLHTYTSSRFAPLIPLAFAGYLGLRRVLPWRRVALGLVALVATAGLTFAPLGVYFLRHPESFAGRASQVNDLRFILQSGNFLPLLQDTLNTLGMFTVQGDPFMRYNLAGRPVFDPLTSVSFYLGLWVSLRALGLRLRLGYSPWHKCQRYGRGLKPRLQAAFRPPSDHTSAIHGGDGISDQSAKGHQGRDRTPDQSPRPHYGRDPIAGAAAALCLIWLVVGLLPSATTGESPHFLRAVSAQPVVYLFPALGLLAAGDWLRSRWKARYAQFVLGGGLACLLVGVGTLTAHDYFLTWNSADEARHIYSAHYAAALPQLAAPADGRTFVSAEYPADIDRLVVDILRGHQTADVSWLDGRSALVVPSAGAATYLFPRHALPPADVLRHYFGEEGAEAARLAPSPLAGSVGVGAVPEVAAAPGRTQALRPTGTGDGDIVTLRAAAPLKVAPSHLLSAKVGDSLELIGYDLPDQARPGGEARVTLYWRLLSVPTQDVSFYAHLVGPLGSLWGQWDGLGYPRDQWRPGDVLIQWHDVPLALGTPPVEYQVEAGGYYRATGEHLPVVQDGKPDDRLRLGSVRVERPTAPIALPKPETPLDARFGDAIRLLGYDLTPRSPLPGDQLNLTLYWQSLGHTSTDYTVFAHFAGPDGRPVAQGDRPPGYGAFPTTQWQPGDIVRDVHELTLPADLPAGRYWLLAGLYDPQSGQRLAPTASPASPVERLEVWLERRTPFQAGARVDADREILTAVDIGGR